MTRSRQLAPEPKGVESCDVLVIGLGPGGGAAAAVAAKRGLSVVAVDRKKEIGSPVQCAEFIPLPLARHAQGTGVLAQRITGMKSVLPSGTVTGTPFQGLMVDRAAFDQALAREAETAGASLRAGSRLAELHPADSMAVVKGPQGARRYRYRLLVGADGPHSTVAKLLGLAPLETVNTRQYTVPLVKPSADTDIWLSERFPGGYAWLFPKGDLANLGVGIDPRCSADMKRPLEELHWQLVKEKRVGRETLFRTGGPIPVGGLRERLVVGNIVFAGDAGGLTHPITGAGIAAAVVSGERAGEAAHALLAAGDADALEDYEEDVRDQFEHSLSRALERRRQLARAWREHTAGSDAVQRRGWIAFEEYFQDHPLLPPSLLTGEGREGVHSLHCMQGDPCAD